MGKPGFPPLLFTRMPGTPNGGWGLGKPGFPKPLPDGRVWEGYAFLTIHLVSPRRCALREWGLR